MAPRYCAFCGIRFKRPKEGRATTAAQWAAAKEYHAPAHPPGTWICGTCRIFRTHITAPGSHKRKRSASADTSDTDDSHAATDTSHATAASTATAATSTGTTASGLAALTAVAANQGAAMLVALTANVTSPPRLVIPYAEAMRRTDITWVGPVMATSSVAYASLAAHPAITAAAPRAATTAAAAHAAASTVVSHAITSATVVAHLAPTAARRTAAAAAAPATSTSTSTPTLPRAPVDERTWRSFEATLIESVLELNNRIALMQHVVTSAEASSDTPNPVGIVNGRYLRVMDTDIPADNARQVACNVINEMITYARAIVPSADEKKSWELLKAVFPLSLQTHTQHANSQYEKPATKKKAAPVYRSKILTKHEDIYSRLVDASREAIAAHAQPDSIATFPDEPHSSVFTATVTVDGFAPATQHLKDRLVNIARAAQAVYTSQTIRSHQAIEVDHVFSPPVDGFGINGLQIYFKRRLCITWLHDELMWCSALNYMLKESVGCALWIAIGLKALRNQFTTDEIDEMLSKSTKRILEVGNLLDELTRRRIPIEYVLQKPGQLVSSPIGTGAAHLVIADGIYMTQLAWNHAFSLNGLRDCLSFWTEQERVWEHVSVNNGSMATTTMIPLYTMQLQGYDIGLQDRIDAYMRRLAQLVESQPSTTVVDAPPSPMCNNYCKGCYIRQDWKRVNGKCIFCLFKDVTEAH